MEITSDDWVRDVNSELASCSGLDELFKKIHIIADMHRFAGVLQYCIPAARHIAGRMCPNRGVTTVVDGESVMFVNGFSCRDLNLLNERVRDSLAKIYKNTQPTHFIVAFDSDRRIKREMFPAWKTNKPFNQRKADIEARKQDLIDHLREKRIQVEIHDGYEADDVLASVAMQCQLLGDECVMATDDKDCWQALGPKTSIYCRPDNAFRGCDWLKAERKIAPKQVVDWLTLVGKNGIKGAHDIGPETASNMLEAFGSIQGILDSTSLTECKRMAIEAIDHWKLREAHMLNRSLPIGRNKYTPHDAV